MNPYIERDGFDFFSNFSGKDYLVVKSERIDEIRAYSEKKGINNFWVSWLEGFEFMNLDLLKGFNVENIVINLSEIDDISMLNSFSRLVYLRIFSDPVKQDIDFNNFPALEIFEGWWTNKLKNLFSCKTLKRLDLWKYKTSSQNLEDLSGLLRLRSLFLAQSNIKNLEGSDNVDNLNQLSIAYCSKFEEVNNPAQPRELFWEELQIESCKKLNLDSLQKLDHLKKLSLINNGEYSTLKPLLDRLPNLEYLNFLQTNLSDGDNGYLLNYPNLKKVAFIDKRTYRFTCQSINDKLSNK